MTRRYLLPETGTFYKANLHCHSTFSDGCWTPTENRDNYRALGYSILAFTDHNCYHHHQQLRGPDFLPLAAFEANINQQAGPGLTWNTLPVYHLNFYDTCPETRKEGFQVPLPAQRYEIGSVNRYIEELKRLGFLCCYNHPWWSMQNYDDYKGLKNLDFFEIYNYSCEHDGLYGYAPQAYDELLRAGQRVGVFATDDNHNRFPVGNPLCDSFGGFTMVKAKSLTYSDVVEALRNGAYYATMGPEIHALYLEGSTLTVDCSPVEKIYVLTQGRDGHKLLAKPGETLTHAQFQLDGTEGYLRVDCRDACGLHANSNAYFLDETRREQSDQT